MAATTRHRAAVTRCHDERAAPARRRQRSGPVDAARRPACEATAIDVTAAVTGEHVIESLEEDPPDLAILGPSIAPGDDATVAGWIRSRATAPILHLRADSPEPGRRAGRGPAVADRSVTAPFDHADVLAAIDDLLVRFADGVGSGAVDQPRAPRRASPGSVAASSSSRPSRCGSWPRSSRSPGSRSPPRACWRRSGRPTGTVDASSMWILVWRVRQKIELDPQHPELLVNVPGAGYRLAVDGRGTAPD